MTTAIQFGERYRSCTEAMEARRALGPGATQADWWRACDRGDWLIWQLERVGRATDNPALTRAIERIAARAIRRGMRSLVGVREEWATTWRRWARRCLDGTDRMGAAVWASAIWSSARAAGAATMDAAWAATRADRFLLKHAEYLAYTSTRAELRLQARDIHREIPEWDSNWEGRERGVYDS